MAKKYKFIETTTGREGADDGPAGGSPVFVELTSDWSTSDNTTLQDITGLAVAMAANTDYRVEAYLIYSTTATATGSELGATGPASPTRVNLQGFITNTATATSNNVASAYGSIVANNNGSTSDRPSWIVGQMVKISFSLEILSSFSTLPCTPQRMMSPPTLRMRVSERIKKFSPELVMYSSLLTS